MEKKIDVGIVGYWFASNYGGVASYYSLYRKVAELGYSPFMVENPYYETDKEGDDVFSRNFLRSQNIKIGNKYNNLQLNQLNQEADIFLLGSDQVLTTSSIKAFGKLFLMEFAEESKKRIAYSASCGGDNLNSDSQLIEYAKSQLHKFSFVSVREFSGIDILEKKFNVIAEQTVDPIFFTTKEQYLELASTVQNKDDEPYLFAYILDPTLDKKRCIEKLSDTLSIKSKIALDGRKYTHENNAKLMDMPESVLPELDFESWLSYYSKASYIFTDSFHGAVMALILNKPFIMYANYQRGYPRFESLARMFSIHSRMITKYDELNERTIKEEINFLRINREIQKETERSSDWLFNTLSTDVKKNYVGFKMNLVKHCKGCSTCFNVCPTQAITMKLNNEGFLNPVVDNNICINCGLCSSKCVALHAEYKNTDNPQCFALMAKDDIREVSSSGGVFTLAANYVLSQEGYVAGAVYNENFSVKHIISSLEKDIALMRGSKYIQSDLNNIFVNIEKILISGKTVLFTGMPCQIAGLYSYLGKNYDNLYTIDLLCHGITSYKVFEKYREDVLGGKTLTDLHFKAKKPWGWHAGINAKFVDGTVYQKIIEADPYYIAYIQGLSKNTTCGTCWFNKLPRQGDLTIGDFWKIQDFDKTFNDNKGTSVVLINNDKGRMLFDCLKNQAAKVCEVPISYAIAGNGIIKYPYKLSAHRDAFFDQIETNSFSKIVDICTPHNVEPPTWYTRELKELFYIAKIAANNRKGRKILLWGDNATLRLILKKYFFIEVDCILSINPQTINGTTVKDFNIIKDRQKEFYVIAFGKAYSEKDADTFAKFGYTDVKDYVYRMFKPIVITNYDLSKNYSDIYGNKIIGQKGIIKKVIFRGFNNTIIFNGVSWNTQNLIFDLSANTIVEIGANCNFTVADTKFDTRGYNGIATIRIKEGCIFMNSLFRLYLHPNDSMVRINGNTTFGENLEFHSNMGKKIIVGKDCLFSHQISLFSGDGHSIIDIKEKKSLNFSHNYGDKSNSIVIGDHVWVGFRSFIMHGTNIGDGSIIGAQSVVKGVFPNNCSIAGSPAKERRRDIAWSRDMYTEDLNRCNGYTKLTSDTYAPISGQRVLVLGGTLFMGVLLVQNLIELGNRVTIATRGKHPDNFGNEIDRVILDISKPESVKNALKGKYYDVVFHNLAYCSNYVKNLLEVIDCGRYIQLSSFEVYTNHHLDIKESEFNNLTEPLVWNEMSAGYIAGKRQAECALFQKYNNKSAVTIRIPYVTKTERLYYYCSNIVKGLPMNIDNTERCLTFVRDIDVGEFLPWIAAQPFNGVINFAAEGYVSIREILDYIEKKTNKKAIIDIKNGSESPFHVFNEGTFSLNLDKLKELGYQPYKLNSWFWKLMDEYILRAIKEA